MQTMSPATIGQTLAARCGMLTAAVSLTEAGGRRSWRPDDYEEERADGRPCSDRDRRVEWDRICDRADARAGGLLADARRAPAREAAGRRRGARQGGL